MKYTHTERPDFARYSEEEKIVLLNILYDSELDLIDECADLKDKLSVSNSLINGMTSKHEAMQDDIDNYNRGMRRIYLEVKARKSPLDKPAVK